MTFRVNLITICVTVIILTVNGIAIGQEPSAEFKVEVLSLPNMPQWEEKTFSGKTQYEITTIDERPALSATSNSSASGLYKKIDIDLSITPYLHWSWRVKNTLGGVKENTRDGDDYPARIYIIHSGGLLFWQTKAISYVWSSNMPINKSWPNAFTGNATMIAVQSGDERLSQWIDERRNVLDDLRKHVGAHITRIDAIGIMTDTDNSHSNATAYYGNIYFSSH